MHYVTTRCAYLTDGYRCSTAALPDSTLCQYHRHDDAADIFDGRATGYRLSQDTEPDNAPDLQPWNIGRYPMHPESEYSCWIQDHHQAGEINAEIRNEYALEGASDQIPPARLIDLTPTSSELALERWVHDHAPEPTGCDRCGTEDTGRLTSSVRTCSDCLNDDVPF